MYGGSTERFLDARRVEALVEQAREGDRESLEQVIETIQGRVYGLAIRMLSHPADAEDATQEILIKVVTHLGEFRRESAFTSWVYRIACNHLLTTRKRRTERTEVTFESVERHVDDALAASSAHASPAAEQGLLVQEMMMVCTHVILICLSRDLRLTYILGEVLEIPSEEGAAILEITPAAFRKRLSRARTKIRSAMQATCGLVNSGNRCRCAGLVPHFVKAGWIRPDKLLFAAHPRRGGEIGVSAEELEHMTEQERVAALFRSQPDYVAPAALLENVRNIMKAASLAIQGGP